MEEGKVTKDLRWAYGRRRSQVSADCSRVVLLDGRRQGDQRPAMGIWKTTEPSVGRKAESETRNIELEIREVGRGSVV